ncbi:MAG TPA: hypothetical protein VEW95_14175 [Candidatus Limnocylindrales bacterium]|nr:hypothetical protein [Candidatus Limnocylindrales bacterium]
MKHKIVGFLMAAVLTASLAPAVAAHHIEFGTPHYSGYCDIGAEYQADGLYRLGFNIARGSTSNRMLGSRSLVTARALEPCRNGTQGYTSLSFIAAANIQGKGDTNGVFNFVQFGIAKTRNASGYHNPNCGAAWNQDQTYFVFTGLNNNTGQLCTAHWVDFDNNGVMDTPVGGRQYLMSITEHNTVSQGTSYNWWRYAITDQTTGLSDSFLQKRTSSDGGLESAWWGCEVGNSANALGVPAGAGPVTVSKPQYLPTNASSAWVYTENSTTYPQWNGMRSYYNTGQSQTGTGESFSCSTDSHQ